MFGNYYLNYYTDPLGVCDTKLENEDDVNRNAYDDDAQK